MGLTRNYGKAIFEWLSKFAPTYREPLDELLFDKEHPKPFEYITYSSTTGNFSEPFIQALTIYSNSTSYDNVMDIVDDIEREVGEHGIKIDKDWGYLTIHKGSPFYQDKPDEDSSYRAGYVNLQIAVYQYNV